VGVTRASYSNNTLTILDTIMSPPLGQSPWQNYPLQAMDDPATGLSVTDHFNTNATQSTNGTWLVTKGTGGSISLNSSGLVGNGWISIPTAASANDYQILSTQNPVFSLQTTTDMCFEVALNITEAATNAASWFAGFTSTITTGFLQNSGAPASSYSGAVIWKATGALAIKCQTSNSTTQSSSATLATEVSGQTYFCGCYINHNDGVTANVTPYLSTVLSNVRTFISAGPTQNLTIASLAKMYFAFGVRAGSGGTAETLLVDFAKASCGYWQQ
jgi:hypothetical protein